MNDHSNMGVCNKMNCSKELKGNYIKSIVLFTIILLVCQISIAEDGSTDDYDFYVDVDGTADFTSIQQAIDAASPGNSIFVYSGRYTENIVIDTPIILNGENKDTTIINSSANDNIINITANGVELSGFTVEICGGFSLYSGIDVQANNTHIYGNKLTIRDIYYYPNGIYITSNRIDNYIHDNIFIEAGLGIDADNIRENIILNNSVNGAPLIYLDSISNQIIQSAGQIILKDCENITINNLDIKHTSESITLIRSNNCIIEECTLQQNERGINSKYSDSIEIINNDIYQNTYGIYLIYSENIAVNKNDVYSNSGALYIDSCERTNTSRNNFYSNGYCLNIFISNLNIIEQNNFANNIRTINSIFCSLNSYDNNYWNRPRFLPKFIFELPRINADWHPAEKPFDI